MRGHTYLMLFMLLQKQKYFKTACRYLKKHIGVLFQDCEAIISSKAVLCRKLIINLIRILSRVTQAFPSGGRGTATGFPKTNEVSFGVRVIAVDEVFAIFINLIRILNLLT